MKILVTGAEGFIGSHLVEALVRKGYEVKAFILYNSNNSIGWLEKCDKEIKDNFEVIFGDVRDLNGLSAAIKGCDFLIHLAALISIPFSYNSPQSYVETNVTGTLNILNVVKNFEVKKMIHTSTSEVYGSAIKVPISETHPLQPQSPYSASKIAADQLSLSFYNSFNTPVTILRPFNTYGPRQSTRAIIPTIITQILNGSKEINLGSLSPTRDFNYINDTVNGFIKCLEAKNTAGKVINLGSNFEISIADLVQLIMEITGVDIKVNRDAQRVRPKKSEVNRLIADNTIALNLLDWKPNYFGKSGLKKGLKATIDWFKIDENLNKYNNFYKYNI